MRESGSAVALGGSPGDNIAKPIFLWVAECNNIGAGRRRSCGEVDNEGGGGDVGSSLTFLLISLCKGKRSTCYGNMSESGCDPIEGITRRLKLVY